MTTDTKDTPGTPDTPDTPENADLLSADFSPGVLNEKVGVRRVNNRPLYLLAAGLAIFLIIIGMVAYDRADKSQKSATIRPEDSKAPVTTVTFAKAAIGDNESGMIAAADPSEGPTPPPELPPVDGADKPAPGATLKPPGGAALVVPPIRPMDGDPQLRAPGQRSKESSFDSGRVERTVPQEQIQPDNDLQRLRELKFKQFEEAVKGRSAVTYDVRSKAGTTAIGISGIGSGSAPQGQSSRDADLARLAAVQAELANVGNEQVKSKSYEERLAEIQGATPTMAGEGVTPVRSASRNDMGKFDGNSDRWRINTEDEAPAQYQLTTSHIIPTILLTGINSELPGPIVAQVSSNVYDTATGKHLLIPQGTKLYGVYSSDIVYGQASLMVAAQRLVYPDGKTRDLGSMPAADAAGSTGMRDQVNNHYVRIFGSSFLMSGITAGVAISQQNQSGNSLQPTARSALSESLGQQLGQTTSQMLSKNLNIAPTLIIRPGYRFNIIVVKDLTFKSAYKPFDYTKRK